MGNGETPGTAKTDQRELALDYAFPCPLLTVGLSGHKSVRAGLSEPDSNLSEAPPWWWWRLRKELGAQE